MKQSLKRVLTGLLAVFVLMGASGARAEEPLPAMPAPIQTLVDEGAQVRFLGRDKGLDAWFTLKNGVEQFFYVLPDKSAFVMGVLFDADGKLITAQQIKRLQEQGDSALNTLSDLPEATPPEKDKAFDVKTPAEQLFSDVEASNWVALGQKNAPVMYSFIDPQCPHCHDFINALRKRGDFEKGAVQLRLIPVGFKEETRAQAAFLIAAPDPQTAWFKHLDGDKTALPAKADLNQQGVQRNLSLMQAWKFNVTPMNIYRDKTGAIKLIRGVPKDMDKVLGDIGRDKGALRPPVPAAPPAPASKAPPVTP